MPKRKPRPVGEPVPATCLTCRHRHACGKQPDGTCHELETEADRA